MNWTVRGYQAGDETALVALFERVFGRAISTDHWRWKLKTLPAPVENVWLATHADTPIFQYAGVATPFWLRGSATTTMVSVDTMTAPEFQRRGLLSQVGQHAYEAWRAAGVPFVLGLPNNRWGSRTTALGWQPLFPLQWLYRPLKPEAMLARRLKLPLLARLTPLGWLWNTGWQLATRTDPALTMRLVHQAGDEFDTLWQRCRDDWAFSVRRDAAWVQWRYLDAPGAGYQVLLASRAGQAAGYAAYRVQTLAGRQIGWLAEIFCARDDQPTRVALVAATLRALRAAGCEKVLTLAVPQTPLYRILYYSGFLAGVGRFSVQLVPLDPALPLELLVNPTHWGLAGADFDVI